MFFSFKIKKDRIDRTTLKKWHLVMFHSTSKKSPKHMHLFFYQHWNKIICRRDFLINKIFWTIFIHQNRNVSMFMLSFKLKYWEIFSINLYDRKVILKEIMLSYWKQLYVYAGYCMDCHYLIRIWLCLITLVRMFLPKNASLQFLNVYVCILILFVIAWRITKIISYQK